MIPQIDGEEYIRNYTLSDSPGKGYFRITVKREDQGSVSRYLHDQMQESDIIEISKPSGDFSLMKGINRH